jgi:transposase
MGVVIPLGAQHVVPQARQVIADADSAVPVAVRPLLAEACDEIGALQERVAQVERQLEALAEQTPLVERLRSIPGVGLLTSTALVAFVVDIQRFPTARHFASYLGLTPRERSGGLRRRLGCISKRGDAYLRMLLIHGARAVLCHAKKTTQRDHLRERALRLERTAGHNKAAVGLANKLARIVWSVWKHERAFDRLAAPQAA